MTELSQLPGTVLPVLGSDNVIIYRNGVAYKVTQNDATLGTIDLGVVITSEATSVVTTAATSTTPFGYSQAQANDIVAELNVVIANQNIIIDAMVTAGWLTIAP